MRIKKQNISKSLFFLGNKTEWGQRFVDLFTKMDHLRQSDFREIGCLFEDNHWANNDSTLHNQFISINATSKESSANFNKHLTLYLPDQICNSSYCQPYNSYNVSSENSVLDQLIIPKLIFFFFLITYLVDIVLIL